VGEHLAFIVGRPPGVEVSIAARRLEGGGCPLFQRFGRLNVVMAINQGRRRSLYDRGFGVDKGVAFGGDDFGGKVEAAELAGHPLRRPADVVAVFALRADAGNAKELAQVLFELGPVRVEILDQRWFRPRRATKGWG
jgi:hypothetical protein